ncbi:MAG: hypothetical protein QM809_17485 [Gordonia sp. (in: high G+C Gram-positive bacteria)]|uniref:hypothetical protein n=1 Tax=Gordonia sp. (in: high G+C Gram-positive bacteria) TaxID=84139 RepID=UPI0039E250BE
MKFLIVVLVVLVVLAAVGWLVALARNSRKVRSGDAALLELYPGHDTSGVPESWARGHDPEARLHRRMRESLAALRGSPDVDVAYLDTRVQLELAAGELDRRLIASALLRVEQKQQFLDRAETAVRSLESVTSTMIAGHAPAPAEVDAALKRLQA